MFEGLFQPMHLYVVLLLGCISSVRLAEAEG